MPADAGVDDARSGLLDVLRQLNYLFPDGLAIITQRRPVLLSSWLFLMADSVSAKQLFETKMACRVRVNCTGSEASVGEIRCEHLSSCLLP